MGDKVNVGAVVFNEDGSATIDFSDMPIKIGDSEVSSITMREPRVNDQLSVDSFKSEGLKEVNIIGSLCEQTPECIGGLTMRQYGRLQDAYRDFMN